MRYIAASGCVLKTLCLDYTFFETRQSYSQFNEEDYEYEIDIPATSAYDEDIWNAVASVNVETMIRIEVKSYTKKYCENFDSFVNDIAYEKQWAVTDDRHHKTGRGNHAFFTWIWILKPATASIKDNVPKSRKAEEKD